MAELLVAVQQYRDKFPQQASSASSASTSTTTTATLYSAASGASATSCHGRDGGRCASKVSCRSFVAIDALMVTKV